MTVTRPSDSRRIESLREVLDLGEAEAIALALECRADLLLADERRGRVIATAAGLKVTGLLGVVALAKSRGLIGFAKPMIEDLIERAHFWIGPELYAEVLAKLGES